MSVGKSSRTPFKHWILNAHLGQIVGVLSLRRPNVPCTADPLLCVDLCAGDGVEVTDGPNQHKSSARIILRHGDWLQRKGFDVHSVFIEKQSATFAKLQDSVDDEIKTMGGTGQDISMMCCDASEFVLSVTHPKQAVFINCDPNSIAQIPMTPEFFDSLTPGTTITTTLGCNPAGIKRLDRDKREEWFTVVDAFTNSMPSWHDAILVRLIKDDAQWAYLTRLPVKWSENAMRQAKKIGAAMWPKGVDVASFTQHPKAFAELQNELFLTRKEVTNG